MIQLNYSMHHHSSLGAPAPPPPAPVDLEEAASSALAKFELSDDNNNNIVTQEDLNNRTLTYTSQDDEGESSSSSSSTSSAWSSFDEDIIEDQVPKPKKSCLVLRSKLFIDTSAAENNSSSNGEMVISGQVNATSSPLFSDSGFGGPSSPSSSSMSSSLSISHTLPSSSSSSNDTCLSSSPTAANPAQAKKRVLFADSCGKELFTIRTMSEPSNCPPKLTSKIVQYFLNREFSSSPDDGRALAGRLAAAGSRQTHSACDLMCYQQQQRASGFFSLSRSYDYGISASNYTADVNQLSGSIAVYSLNFAQPAGDYLHFRKRLEDKFVSLENVVLNLFQINGTIKVKNVDYHKQVFVRCSFDGWKTFQDYAAQYVSGNFYFSSSSDSTAAPSSPTHSSSATFYVSNNSSYVPQHKEYDAFRFEFQLPKTAQAAQQTEGAASSPSPTTNETSSGSSSKELYSDFGYEGRNLNLTASIQMCVCYRCGHGDQVREFWDSNDGKNYEILQYVIDIERLKPSSSSSSSKKPSASSSFSANYHEFAFESVSSPPDGKLNGIYY